MDNAHVSPVGRPEQVSHDQSIAHVSDTARWVAAYRAEESARADALFNDSLAALLAGEHGLQIAKRVRRAMGGDISWGLVTRTVLIDELIAASLAEGCDCVLNLAAGLDTRPYRCTLPASLTWIEADLPGILEEKTRLLAGVTPRCQLQREPIDLSNAKARAKLLDAVTRKYKRVLVVTEGLLPYLDEAAVTELGRDLRARANLVWWITDISSPLVIANMRRRLRRELQHAPMKFAPANGIGFFEALGWKTLDAPVVTREAVRLKRAPWFVRPFLLLFPEVNPRRIGWRLWVAIARFGRDTLHE